MTNRLKGFIGDFLYSMIGLVLMNGIIQIVLYPFLNHQMGAERFGDMLTLLSVISIMGTTFGTAANYSRMLGSTREQDVKGDYNLFLLVIAGIALPVALTSFLWLGESGVLQFGGYYLLMVVSILRYYADVEFRLNINYKRFFLYYLFISVGYLLGILLYPATKSWIVTILMGEVLAVGYVIFRGHIFSPPYFSKSDLFMTNIKSMLMLSGADLIAAIVLNADRLLLQGFVGGAAVTLFYTATLLGKVISLISTPLNGVIIGHLTRYEGRLSSSLFLKICVCGIGLGGCISGVCVGMSHIFVRVLYPDIYEQTAPYFFLANLGAVFYFISGILVVVLLRFTDEKYQLYINLIYFAVFLALAVPMTAVWKLWGMAWALVLVNMLKIIMIMIVGKIQLDAKK